MGIKHITFEGTAQTSDADVKMVCAHCGETSGDNATIVFDFRQKKALYLCSNKKCKKMNDMKFGKDPLPPMPKTRVGR